MRRILSLGVIHFLLIAQAHSSGGVRKDLPSAPSIQPATTEVKIDNFSFGPETVTLPVGATVTWTNRDDIPHTVVSNDGLFKSKALDTDDQFSFTFTKPGTYSYFCSIHPKMTGKIIVR